MAYDMLNWMCMSPSLRAANHFKSTELDGVTPANHLFTQVNTGNFYWIKGDGSGGSGGYPWDIQLYDSLYIYLSTTELSYASASEGKRFESLNPAIGFKGVPFAKRFMNIGESVYSTDSRLAIYTSCGSATYTNIGNVKCTLTGPYTETIPGAGSTLPSNITTIHDEYEWSLDGSYNHQAGSTKETYTLTQPYGLVRWQTQNWNTGTSSYDAPNNATNYNILTPGTVGLPYYDPCGFGVNGLTPSANSSIAGGASSVQMVRPKTYELTDPHWRAVWESVYKLTQRNISFGSQVDSKDQNISGRMVEVANTGAANVEFAVIHNLGRVPLFYDVKYINGSGNVYDSGTPWTASTAYFKCSLANAKVRLFIH